MYWPEISSVLKFHFPVTSVVDLVALNYYFDNFTPQLFLQVYEIIVVQKYDMPVVCACYISVFQTQDLHGILLFLSDSVSTLLCCFLLYNLPCDFFLFFDLSFNCVLGTIFLQMFDEYSGADILQINNRHKWTETLYLTTCRPSESKATCQNQD